MKQVQNILRNYWPAVLGIFILWGIILYIMYQSLQLTHGRLVYALDDPYIHMAMAKNFAQHGIWGITPYEGVSASSSLLWTFLLSIIYVIFGVNEYAPYVLNFIFASFLLLTLYQFLLENKCPPFYSFLVLLGTIYLARIPAVIFIGQEHILHSLITVWFVYLSAKVLQKNEPGMKTIGFLQICILGMLVTTVRYEGLFLISCTCLLFLIRKQWKQAVILGISSVIPLMVFGIISKFKGWYILPNSVMLKGDVPAIKSVHDLFLFISTVISKGYDTLTLIRFLFLLFIVSVLLILFRSVTKKEFWSRAQIILSLFVMTLCLHLMFSGTEWYRQFGRYSTYLVCLGLFGIAYALWELMAGGNHSLGRVLAYAGILFVLTKPLVSANERVRMDFRKVPIAMKNIYEQQYQMGLFAKLYCTGEGVVLNDIGAVNYLSDIHCMDIVGIGSLPILKEKRNGNYDSREIENLAKVNNMKIAMVYDSLFEPANFGKSNKNKVQGSPPSWVKVGKWTISQNMVCGGDDVYFYAIDSTEIPRLIYNLEQFSKQMPKDVRRFVKSPE